MALFQFWFIMESYGSNLGYSQLYRYLLVNYICCKVPEYERIETVK